jgi:TonB family protein
MLNAGLNRHPLTRRARVLTALLFFALALSLAGVASYAQGPFATVAGSITDSQHAALPNATLVLTNTETQARNEVRSDRSGRFELIGLPPGEYVLEANVLGFRNYRVTLALNGQQVDRDIVLDVGTLQETITVVDSDDPPRVTTPEDLEKVEQRLKARAARQAAVGCPAVQPGVVPTGGNIRPPAKLVDVRPEYPPALRRDKIGGTVDIDARIATDGSVKEARPDPSAHPDLARAAVDAVLGWRFDETLLNCVPIEVSMSVTVTFKPRP